MDSHLHLQIPSFVYNTQVVHGPWPVPPVDNDDTQQQHVFTSDASPFDYPTEPFLNYAPPPPPPSAPTPDLSLFLAATAAPAPSPLGLPIYSATGFDLLSILARVATRPCPRIVLGPVDLTCSFVVVDTRQFDHPIVYCSPSFCLLTGYAEHEVLGRNCRFLQAPGGQVARGEVRRWTSQEAVRHLRKSLMADKECQTSIVNYRKSGAAFINLVTVIPVPPALPEEQEVVYQVGFQVDLTEQPNAILEKLRDGSYLVDYAASRGVGTFGRGVQGLGAAAPQHPPLLPVGGNARDRKANAIPPLVIGKELNRMLADPNFLRSIPITNVSTTASSAANATYATGAGAPASASADDNANANAALAAAASTAGATSSTTAGATSTTAASTTASNTTAAANHPLSMILLEAAPDFVHVVDLKGKFLYVAPSVRRVLGWEAEEMVGGAIADYAHPEDVVPLTRELKEGSATGAGAGAGVGASAGASATTGESGNGMGNGMGNGNGKAGGMGMPRSVDLMYRARTKMGRYVWVESRGRLLVEPGKGRKAIILSGRAREMMSLRWEDVRRAGGLARGVRVPVVPGGGAGSKAGAKDNANGNANGRTKEENTKEKDKHLFRDVEQEVWGTLAGVCKDTATFMSVGRGVLDVLGWTPDELVGRGLAAVLCEGDEATREVLGGFVREMRAAQRRRRASPSLHQAHMKIGDDGRVMKLRCRLRTRAGVDSGGGSGGGGGDGGGRGGGTGTVDVWFILYCADVEDEGEQLVLEARGAGESISPAALVFQIRRVGAQVMMPKAAEGEGVVEALGGVGLGMGVGVGASSMVGAVGSSSLAGAVGAGLGVSVTSPSTTTAPAMTTTSADMFDELSTTRGTSWQYELQQLRITNMRLREELAVLEAAEAEAASAGQAKSTGEEAPNAVGAGNPPASATGTSGYEAYEGYGAYEAYDAPQQQRPPPQQQKQQRMYAEIAPLPLYTMQPQQSARRVEQGQQRQQQTQQQQEIQQHDPYAEFYGYETPPPLLPSPSSLQMLSSPPPSLHQHSNPLAMALSISQPTQHQEQLQQHHQQPQQQQQQKSWKQPYLHQPAPVQQYVQQQQQQSQHDHQRHQQQGMVSRPPRRGTPMEWGAMSASQAQPHGYGSSLKRSWSSIDAP